MYKKDIPIKSTPRCSLTRQRFRLLLIIVLLSGLILPHQVAAYESFTTDLFLGFNLAKGIEVDSRVLTIIFNPSDKVEFVLPGIEEDVFSFNFAELYFGYDPTVHRPLLVPEHVRMAVFEGSFADVTPQTLDELDFVPDPPPVLLSEGEIAIFLTANSTYYMLGNIVLNVPDWTLTFDYQVVIPEPATFLLVGIGGFGLLLRMRRRTCKNKNNNSDVF